MENASKALIIAGAILLSILIITLGLIVYNQAREAVKNVNLSEQEIEVFNQKFSSYEGNNVSGTQVNNLIQAVSSSNIAAARDVTGQYITLEIPAGVSTDNNKHTYKVDGNPPQASGEGKVKPGLTYKVTMVEDDKTGLISSITIEQAS